MWSGDGPALPLRLGCGWPASVDHRHIDAQQADGSRAVRNRAVGRAVRAHDRNVTFGNPIRIPMVS